MFSITNSITLRQLQYLVAVVELRHFGKAAERCHVTQSTLSSGLKDLEHALDVTLVERTKRRVLPTPLGETVAAQARAVLARTSAIAETVKAQAAPLTGPLRLGVIPTVGPFVLPRVLRGLRCAYPELKLYLREGQTRFVLDQLNAGELEAAIIALPYDVSDFATMDLGRDPLWLAGPVDHPMTTTRRSTVSSTDFSAEEMLLLEDGHCLREHALDACRLRAASPLESFQATSLYTLIEMVANGLGVTFVPEIALSAGLARRNDVAIKPLAKDAPARRIALVWRRSFHRDGDIAAFGAYLKGSMAKLRVRRR